MSIPLSAVAQMPITPMPVEDTSVDLGECALLISHDYSAAPESGSFEIGDVMSGSSHQRIYYYIVNEPARDPLKWLYSRIEYPSNPGPNIDHSVEKYYYDGNIDRDPRTNKIPTKKEHTITYFDGGTSVEYYFGYTTYNGNLYEDGSWTPPRYEHVCTPGDLLRGLQAR